MQGFRHLQASERQVIPLSHPNDIFALRSWRYFHSPLYEKHSAKTYFPSPMLTLRMQSNPPMRKNAHISTAYISSQDHRTSRQLYWQYVHVPDFLPRWGEAMNENAE